MAGTVNNIRSTEDRNKIGGPGNNNSASTKSQSSAKISGNTPAGTSKKSSKPSEPRLTMAQPHKGSKRTGESGKPLPIHAGSKALTPKTSNNDPLATAVSPALVHQDSVISEGTLQTPLSTSTAYNPLTDESITFAKPKTKKNNNNNNNNNKNKATKKGNIKNSNNKNNPDETNVISDGDNAGSSGGTNDGVTGKKTRPAKKARVKLADGCEYANEKETPNGVTWTEVQDARELSRKKVRRIVAVLGIGFAILCIVMVAISLSFGSQIDDMGTLFLKHVNMQMRRRHRME